MSKQHWSDVYTQLIEDCEKRSEKLTDWEANFLDSLSRQLGNDRRPTDKQIECLDNIWEKVTG